MWFMPCTGGHCLTVCRLVQGKHSGLWRGHLSISALYKDSKPFFRRRIGGEGLWPEGKTAGPEPASGGRRGILPSSPSLNKALPNIDGSAFFFQKILFYHRILSAVVNQALALLISPYLCIRSDFGCKNDPVGVVCQPGFEEWLSEHAKNKLMKREGKWYLIAEKYAENGS